MRRMLAAAKPDYVELGLEQRRHGAYMMVDTGKFTSAQPFALETADMLMP
jgi:hypothetical protein